MSFDALFMKREIHVWDSCFMRNARHLLQECLCRQTQSVKNLISDVLRIVPLLLLLLQLPKLNNRVHPFNDLASAQRHRPHPDAVRRLVGDAVLLKKILLRRRYGVR